MLSTEYTRSAPTWQCQMAPVSIRHIGGISSGDSNFDKTLPDPTPLSPAVEHAAVAQSPKTVGCQGRHHHLRQPSVTTTQEYVYISTSPIPERSSVTCLSSAACDRNPGPKAIKSPRKVRPASYPLNVPHAAQLSIICCPGIMSRLFPLGALRASVEPNDGRYPARAQRQSVGNAYSARRNQNPKGNCRSAASPEYCCALEHAFPEVVRLG